MNDNGLAFEYKGALANIHALSGLVRQMHAYPPDTPQEKMNRDMTRALELLLRAVRALYSDVLSMGIEMDEQEATDDKEK